MKIVLLALVGAVLAAVPQKPAPPTFAKEIAPILYARCATCHHPGDVAPFSLTDYASARRFAPTLARVVASGQMPPWKPVGAPGTFADERRLTDGERAALLAWVSAGAPEGDPKAAPAPPRFADGWRLGPPDVVLTMPPGVTVPAEGEDVYRMFPLGLDLPRDRVLRAVEVRPGNRRVVHHAVVALDRSGTARELDAKDPGPGYSNFGGFGFIPAAFLGGYAPGQTVHPSDGRVAGTLPKGHADVVLQMHYHPSGKPEADRSEIGLYFTERKPEHNPAAAFLASERIDIPAGERRTVVRDDFRLPTGFNATSVFPHMHLIGKSVRVWAELPDRSTRELLRIDDWDFQWQDTYGYAAPIRLPKDTVVRCEWTYDNSAANPRNPHAPPRRVTAGENSTDEMAGLILGGYCDDGWGDLALGAADLGHLWEVSEAGKRARTEAARVKAPLSPSGGSPR